LPLIHTHNNPHNKKRARKPARKETPGFWGMSSEIMKAATAMLHQGKYKHERKLKRTISIIDAINFIFIIGFIE